MCKPLISLREWVTAKVWFPSRESERGKHLRLITASEIKWWAMRPVSFLHTTSVLLETSARTELTLRATPQQAKNSSLLNWTLCKEVPFLSGSKFPHIDNFFCIQSEKVYIVVYLFKLIVTNPRELYSLLIQIQNVDPCVALSERVWWAWGDVGGGCADSRVWCGRWRCGRGQFTPSRGPVQGDLYPRGKPHICTNMKALSLSEFTTTTANSLPASCTPLSPRLLVCVSLYLGLLLRQSLRHFNI